ncbi:MAG: bifunctional phosphopantothenoylcysteine decarboxylase/phosphopantothenate--cysteine ligase CoaBC [Myxococcota bacterium]|nr:bifunctional phosphopantothenoylcysteine decarboxylase/phosphopantothenate--cysteine ligase CoaBC [Myxococcota bacterium]
MGNLKDKRVLLGVSGGIAAYKTPDLVRRLRDAGAEVEVQLTSAGARFVSPLALEVVSGHPVGRSLWDTDQESQIVHTDAGKRADLILLAPATANLIGRIRHGLADDLLTTTVMASETPVLICPAMNTDMWNNPLVQENLEALLRHPRFSLLQPDTGELACGVIGQGRLPDAAEIVEACSATVGTTDLAGLQATVSAGPTREAVDPVRYLTNHSTGTMGLKLAEALFARGASVTLVAGPGVAPVHTGIKRVDVTTAQDMAAAIEGLWPATDVLVMAAAVADYRPAEPRSRKLTKGAGDLSLELERTEDILRTCAHRPGRDAKILVGFAAETHELEERARAKLQGKNLDWIVANDVSAQGIGFGTGDNAGLLLGQKGESHVIDRCPKTAFAARIVEHLSDHLRSHLNRRTDEQ